MLMGEYRQAFKNSDLILNMGYTKGYKNTSRKKKSGDKSHFFTKFTKNFMEIMTQKQILPYKHKMFQMINI